MGTSFWLTVGTSALIGACLTGLWNIVKDILSRRAEAKALENGLIAEVKSLSHLLQVRRYKMELEDTLQEMIENDLETIEFSVFIHENYNPVYKANVQKIGMLNNELSEDIVKFHAYLFAFACDLHEQSMLAKDGYTQDALKEMVQILNEAEVLSDKIAAYK
ncbi:TPA: hypothetical protein R8G71_001380 [Citrobacter youngae]|uniref:hypothetical protein n=1 Tax=Citrobacter youngae TaxID=133448 RepID=UPI00295CB962|nr:hypothetical protein [Citrobacter youngae]MEB0864159.1 hypothetical protein [Citrobacter youngae]HEF0085360.1 hypothetical protein [Citrobacter youngae]HEF0094390.1 hypothetical protein [Citrobacter youngae]